MARGNGNIGLEILEWIREVERGEYGRVTNIPSVSSVRERTGLSQSRLLGVSVRPLQEWEQARRVPSAAARPLLLIAQKIPRALLDVA
jgi:putative transcriptional regulator